MNGGRGFSPPLEPTSFGLPGVAVLLPFPAVSWTLTSELPTGLFVKAELPAPTILG